MNRQGPDDCPLCLDNGLLTTPVIARSDAAYAIPVATAPGNHFVIPIRHAESLLELDDTWWRSFKDCLRQIPGLEPPYNVSINIGEVAGQRQKHLHFWVVPRRDGLPSSGKGLAALMREADASADANRNNADAI